MSTSILRTSTTRAIGSSVFSGMGRSSYRSFGVYAQRMSGKEDGLHDPKRAETIETKVKESVESRQWKDEIASNSESIVKAERDEVKSVDEHIKDLQKETAKMVNKVAAEAGGTK